MATCKDCIHYEDVCGGFIPSDLDSDVFDYCRKGITDEIPDIDERCDDFKNKADFVEVVRCKDCKKRYVPYYCALWHSTVNGRELFLERGEYFSCSHGERKEQ